MNEIWPTVASVLGVFLVMGIGAACRHLKWLTTQADRTLANLTANVMLPAYFIHKFSESDEIGKLTDTWQPPVAGFLSTSIGIGIAYLFAKTFGKYVGLVSDGSHRAFALCAGICNYGYIPLPLAEQFYESVVIELIIHNVGVDVALWSVGIAVIGAAGGGSWKRPLTSPPLWAVILSILATQFGWTQYLPAPILSAVGAIGNCAIPLGLMLSGAIIVDFLRDGDWIGAPKVIVAAIGIRLLILPVLMLTATYFLVPTGDLRTVMMLQAAMPSAVFPIVLVKLYNQDSDTALRVVLWTSIAGIVSIPIWLSVGSWWLGI